MHVYKCFLYLFSLSLLSDKRVARAGSNAALVALVTSQPEVTFLSPGCSPTAQREGRMHILHYTVRFNKNMADMSMIFVLQIIRCHHCLLEDTPYNF